LPPQISERVRLWFGRRQIVQAQPRAEVADYPAGSKCVKMQKMALIDLSNPNKYAGKAVTERESSLAFLLEQTLSGLAAPRLDVRQAGQLFAEVFPEGFDGLVGTLR
jgi:hypothetical protein